MVLRLTITRFSGEQRFQRGQHSQHNAQKVDLTATYRNATAPQIDPMKTTNQTMLHVSKAILMRLLRRLSASLG